MKQSRFATARFFSSQKVGRLSIILLFVSLIVVSRAYQPSFRVCKVVSASRFQRSVSLKVQAESTAATESSITLFSDDVSDEIKIKRNSIEAVSSSPIFERVQRGLARLTEIIPKPIRLAVVAVASSLLLFELSKTLLFLAVPIIAVLGGIQSLKDGLNDDAPSTKIYDTDVIEFPMSSSSAYTAYTNNPSVDNEMPAEWLNESPTSSMEKFETQSKERGERLKAIQKRISETSGDLLNVMSSASSLREKLSSYLDKIDRVDIISKNLSKSD